MRTFKIIAFCCGLLCCSAYATNENSSQINNHGLTSMQSKTSEKQLPGEAFLKTNKSEPSVITLADGLQYKVLVAGKGGEHPKINDTVTVNYAGKLIDGTEFDSSYKRGVPATFPVNGVISGWTEALQLMTVGSIWELYIPAHLAYGERGALPAIGPNETLIFKVELLGINTH
jgi:FKBP-type peptidyl-prolyl cis-trans isomerase FklB